KLERVALAADRECVVATAQRGRHQRNGALINGIVRQLDELHADLLSKSAHKLGLGDHAELDERAPQSLAARLLLLHCVEELVFRQNTVCNEDVSQLSHAAS